jgi:hypothetical protein
MCSASFVPRCALAILLLPLTIPAAWAAVATDKTVSTDRSTSSASITSPSFTTAAANELLLAFIATDGASPGITVTGVTGAGLTWTLVQRTNVQLGTAEIWRAFAPATLSAVTVRAALSQSVAASMTVVTFTGVDASDTNGSGAIGATRSGNSGRGAPTATLTTTRAGSWVFGVGNDWDTATARTLGAGQTMVHQYLASIGDTYWVQRQTSPTATSGTLVTINDTAPSADRYNLSIVEVLPPSSVNAFAISGSIAPIASGAGTLLTLGGAANATTTSDASGNYSFGGLQNGTYTVTPGKAGFTFTPAFQTVTVNGANQPAINFTATPVPTFRISGTISPSGNGAGALLTLSGSATATTTAGSTGTYSFSGLANGSYDVTPSKSGFTFSPASLTVPIGGADAVNVDFTATALPPPPPPPINYPDLSDIIPTGQISIAGVGTSRVFQYTHDTFNGGPGPLVIQPVYNQASGTYQGIQYVYTFSGGQWTLSRQVPLAGVFIFHAIHGHFHFPFTTYGLYAVAADGGIGAPVALSDKIGFCIADSFIYAPSLPNAGALGNLGSCTDPTSLRGLDIGAVDEYDKTDEGQSISLANVPDGTYWLRAIVDPNNFFAESDKSNNETDVQFTIAANTVQILQTISPVLPPPPAIALTAPLDAASLTGTVTLQANPATTTGVQFPVDGQALGSVVTTAPYSLPWDTTTVPNGSHWLAAQTTSAAGRTGTSAVAQVTIANGPPADTTPPTVQIDDPTAAATVFATIPISATAADDTAVVSLQFYVDGNPVGAALTAPPYVFYWNTTTVVDGQHTITASATDTVGHIGNSAPVSVTVDNSHPANVIGKDVVVSVDSAGTMQTAPFSTSVAGDLLVAFVAYDGPQGSPQTATVSGAGLTWTLLKRSNTQSGTAEIWTARASGLLSNVTVMSQPGTGAYHGSMTVIAFTNAAGTGVVGQSSAPSGAPDIFLPGVTAGDWVFAVGNDWDQAIGRTPVSGQVLVHQRVDSTTGDTFWVQSTGVPSTANALVDIHDSAPTTDQWNYVAVEIVATRR